MSIRSIYPDRQESTSDTLECREQSECVSVIREMTISLIAPTPLNTIPMCGSCITIMHHLIKSEN